jgi:hypothetical protein
VCGRAHVEVAVGYGATADEAFRFGLVVMLTGIDEELADPGDAAQRVMMGIFM